MASLFSSPLNELAAVFGRATLAFVIALTPPLPAAFVAQTTSDTDPANLHVPELPQNFDHRDLTVPGTARPLADGCVVDAPELESSAPTPRTAVAEPEAAFSHECAEYQSHSYVNYLGYLVDKVLCGCDILVSVCKLSGVTTFDVLSIGLDIGPVSVGPELAVVYTRCHYDGCGGYTEHISTVVR